MISLADFAHPETQSWAEAREAFVWPAVDRYNIAADCLRADADKVAVIAVDGRDRRTLTFGQLDALSSRFGAGLRTLGVSVGDRVAVKLSQGFWMAVAVLAVLRIGAIVVPVSNTLGEDALRHRLEDSAPRVLVCSGSAEEIAFAREAGAVPVSTGNAVLTGTSVPVGTTVRKNGLPTPSRTQTSALPDKGLTMDDVLARAPEDAGGFADTGLDTPALLLYTSGTTGASKGVLHGHRVVLGHHPTDLVLDHVHPDDVSYTPVDWAWAGGLLLGLLVPLALGITVVAYRDTHFDPERTIEVLRDTGASVGLFPPTALRMLRRSSALTRAASASLRLRSIISGTETVEPELADWARDELGVSINDAYGQTEANMLIGHSSALEPLARESLGMAYPGRDIEILSPQLTPCPPDVAGEIAVRADDPVCMLRYWNAPDATAKKIRNGWLLTGDAGRRDAEGQIYFQGRTDDLIKSGGYRIGPAEVEAAIMLDPAVVECAAIAVPDPVRGQAVAAYVTLTDPREGTPNLTSRLRNQVRKKVGAYAYPRAVFFVDTLPRTTAGKIDRGALRRAEQQARDAEAAS